jgi:hypothetical protein
VPGDPTYYTCPCPADEACPHCGATHGVQPEPAPPTVQAWTCAACGLDFAITTVALSIVSVLPAPELRTGAFLNLLREEVHHRSGKGERTMTDVPICTCKDTADRGGDHGGAPGRSPLPPPEFGAACRHAQPDEPPMDLTLPGPESGDVGHGSPGAPCCTHGSTCGPGLFTCSPPTLPQQDASARDATSRCAALT